MQKTLTKIYTELSKDKPDISRVLWMLEVLIEEPEQGVRQTIELPVSEVKNWVGSKGTGDVVNDEAALLDAKAGARLKNVDMSAIQTEN